LPSAWCLIATRLTPAGIYEKTTKKPADQILKDIDRDYYMTAEEAREYGIVDQIFSNEMRTGQSAST
jgi:ATP-dependent Clp protease protease subunit